MKYLFVVLTLLTLHQLSAQEYHDASINIIPNPGFEIYAAHPVGWFYSGKHFTTVMKYWSSPTAASPDVYGPEVKVPKIWRDKGFGTATPREGTSMGGITVVGCGDGKPHCREYVQTPLLDALVIGQRYELTVWVKPFEGGYILDELGVVFNDQRTYLDDDIRLMVDNVVRLKGTSEGDSQWVQMKAEFEAETEADYLIIGNFLNDLDSRVTRPENQKVSFGYFYIDDVQLRKVAPILPVEGRKATWEGKELVPPATFTLANIFFDTDQAVLLPRSYAELDKLIELLAAHPEMKIRINGHTDSDGGEAYNDALSMRRAEAVESYLKNHKIKASRLTVAGFGKNRPVADNTTAEGKQLNRRVEFTIVSM